MAKSLEERKNIRRAFFFGFLTLVALLVFLYVGFPTVARFATFLTDFRKSSEPVDPNDTTPPAPPRFDSFSEITREDNIDLEGSTEPGATVIVYLNAKEEELLANKSGDFSFTFSLQDGENSFSAKAKDASGNEGQETQVFTIVHDSSSPEITITKPSDGDIFAGSQERQVTIEGRTEEGASVNINDRVVVVDPGGSFSFTTTLSEGENKFTVKAEDRAGNTEETSLTLNFSS